MTINLKFVAFIIVTAAFAVMGAVSASGQPLLINEIEIDPPSTTTDQCQYIELRGTPGSVVPANTYFLSINSDSGNFGFANQAINISGQSVGSNGTITLLNNFSGGCPNRTFGSGTTILNFISSLFLGQGSETYLIVRSTSALPSGEDFDSDDDGVFNAALGITVLDGFALLINPEEEYVYGASAGVVNISNTISVDQPDAVTRFPGNSTPFAAAAFYFGELASTPDETTAYVDPRSPNFPAGGALTPGAPNGPAAAGFARADFDGDGRTDLSVFRPSEGNWYLNRTNGGYNTVTWGVATDQIVPGDYDADGKADTAVYRSSNVTWYIVNSNGFTISTTVFGAAGDVPVEGDYDGDNKNDVAVWRNSNATWYVINSGGGGFEGIPWGASGDSPVPGDYDGDGSTDLAVFRPSNGTWSISASGGGTGNYTWGVTGDRPVPADFDNDDKDDVAVWRPGNGTWYIIQSSDASFRFVVWGESTDVPVPGDYDGDGRDDPAVFRNGTWFLNRSTDGFASIAFGIAGDIPVPAGYIP